MVPTDYIKTGTSPLVSIIVITYNSSRYILDTLDSIKNQTYYNIELIVTDDASTDNTTELCRNWLEGHMARFPRSELITSEINTGISANCNRGIKLARGEWIKLIAGDDALFEDAIENIVTFISHNNESEVLLTQGELFEETFDHGKSLGIQPDPSKSDMLYSSDTTAVEQLEYLLGGGFHFTPGLFFKNIFGEIGLYDEQYTLSEDVPFFLKLGLYGKKIRFAPILTIKYRKHRENLTSGDKKILPSYMHQVYLAAYKASLKYGKQKFIVNNYWHKLLTGYILNLGNNGTFCSLLDKIRIEFQPIRFNNLYNRIRRKRIQIH
jgi:glycosyltransferase involved in cell wall biosynthesis